MVGLYFIVDQIFANKTNEPVGPMVVNPAIDMLDRNVDPLQALEASLQTERMDDHPSHKEISQQARQLVIAGIDKHLNANPWRFRDLDNAVMAMRKAITVDQHPNMRRKQEEVDFENRAYSMSLEQIDPNADTALFLFRGSLEDSMKTEGGEGDLILQRFEIKEVRDDRVAVADQKRGNRPLTWHTNGEISSP